MRHSTRLRFLAPLALAATLIGACSEGDSTSENVLPSSASGGSTAQTGPGAMGADDTPAGGAGDTPGTGGAGEITPGGVAASAGTGGQASAAGAQGGSGGAPATESAGGTAGALNPISADTIKIMAVGDSITRATCWRARLWEALNQSFAGRFDMVGTLQSNPGCTPANFDADNQGYSSSLITEIAAGITSARTCDPACPTMADLAQAFMTAQPNVVLMHFGTNDVWNGRAPADILSGYSQVVDAARAANPNVVILVAQIIPMNVTEATCTGCTCAGCPTAVPALDQQIVGWAAGKSSAASPVVVVDQLTGYDATADNRDGVHPNEQGSQKIADRWFAALAPLFGG
jgi:lysophospholipase L1-like esterase